LVPQAGLATAPVLAWCWDRWRVALADFPAA
jgi:hypothetical protein